MRKLQSRPPKSRPLSRPKLAFTRMTVFQAALLACAGMAALLPACALIDRGLPAEGPATAEAGIAFGGSLICLLILGVLVRGLGQASQMMRACLSEGGAAAPAKPVQVVGEAGGLINDAAELAQRMDAMRHRLTHRHPVTGLPTREPFLADLAGDMGDPTRTIVLGVVRFADYDRLAAFDQAAADRALAAFAERLRKALPASRTMAQVDRDSFAVWFVEAPTSAAAAGELQAVAYVLGQELVDGGLKLLPDARMGAAVFPADGRTPVELLTRAVAAVADARHGAGKVAFFSPDNSAAERERFALEQDLRVAVSRGELLLHYQPLVDLGAGRVIGAEALLRWQHPTLGLVPPGRFIPILEQSGRMDEAGLWVLTAACREARFWREQGLHDLKMAVNLSTTQCRDPRLRTVMMSTLERHGLPPSALELELTETTAMEDAEHTRELLEDLRAAGVSVAIDDFGAGYSSMSYLKNLPFSKLKIDREFVTDVHQRKDSRAICSALIELARGLDIAVLAEGVETLEELQALQALGCRLFQGYLFARPMESSAFIAKVKDTQWLAELASPARRQMAELTRRTAGGLSAH